jgi:antirestriction protein ArdC
MANNYEAITQQIIAQLEAGVIPWRKPWTSRTPTNLKSLKPYRGINVFLLGCQGYASPYWLTYRQAGSLGGQVRRGQHGTRICFWSPSTYSKENPETHEQEEKRSLLLRFYTVFNLAQVDGLPSFETSAPVDPIAECEAIVAGMPNRPPVKPSDAAWYQMATDTVGMPPIGTFTHTEEYYSTLFHELTHSTRHSSRCGRDGVEQKANHFGDELYSKEELVAELGAAMLCGMAGISKVTIDNSAAYIANWLGRLRSDNKLIISAASQAQKSSDYILAVNAITVDTTAAEAA